ncbi:hypothetical protein MHH67_07795 [Bacillus sp. FSL K6-0047]|nr:hypothetical protein [Shouchella clausii]
MLTVQQGEYDWLAAFILNFRQNRSVTSNKVLYLIDGMKCAPSVLLSIS